MADLRMHSVEQPASPTATRERLRVLFVPDSIYWITGTLAKAFAASNDWIEATIISGPVLPLALQMQPGLLDDIDLVHFTCTYASHQWLPLFQQQLPCVTSHHHVTDWSVQQHNAEGDAVIVSSREWREDAIGRGVDAARIVTIPYGVDCTFFVPSTPDQRAAVRRELGLRPDDVVVGFFAKQSSNELDRKGTDVFVNAIEALHKLLPTACALIVGPGWSGLIGRLRTAGVRCAWVPFAADASEVRRMYWALDFYWVTARVEGGPVTLLEAMSCGICCISTPVGLAREIVADGQNAVSIPMNDASAAARATAFLATDHAARARIGIAARATIVRCMDSSVVTRRVGIVYDIAHDNFRMRRPDVRRRPAPMPISSGRIDTSSDDVPRRACSRQVRKNLAICERLAWAHSLHLQGQAQHALKLFIATWARNPLSALPPRYAARMLIPAPLLSRVITIKNAVARASRRS